MPSPVSEQVNDGRGPRSFTLKMREECWAKAVNVIGRDPERWKLDEAGNIVSRRLIGCDGCLCHDYDHIVPYSKGGKTESNNCQILQTRVNRRKSNIENFPKSEMIQSSCATKFGIEELDALEMAIYGDVHRPDLRCKCKSVRELEETIGKFSLNVKYSSKKKNQDMALPHCSFDTGKVNG